MQLIKDSKFAGTNSAIILGNAVWLLLGFAAGLYSIPIVGEFMDGALADSLERRATRGLDSSHIGIQIGQWMISPGSPWGYFMLVVGTAGYFAVRWWKSLMAEMSDKTSDA